MVLIIIVLILGLFMGRILRGKGKKLVSKLIMITIFLLLFFLGINVGSNENIISNIFTIGVDAFMITLGGVIGSVLLAWLIYKYYYQNKKQDKI